MAETDTPASMAGQQPAVQSQATVRLWVINDVLSILLRCSCGWSERFDNGVEFGALGYAATIHQRGAHATGDSSGSDADAKTHAERLAGFGLSGNLKVGAHPADNDGPSDA